MNQKLWSNEEKASIILEILWGDEMATPNLIGPRAAQSSIRTTTIES